MKTAFKNPAAEFLLGHLKDSGSPTSMHINTPELTDTALPMVVDTIHTPPWHQWLTDRWERVWKQALFAAAVQQQWTPQQPCSSQSAAETWEPFIFTHICALRSNVAFLNPSLGRYSFSSTKIQKYHAKHIIVPMYATLQRAYMKSWLPWPLHGESQKSPFLDGLCTSMC